MTKHNDDTQESQPTTTHLKDAARIYSVEHDEPSFTVLFRGARVPLIEFLLKRGMPENDAGEVLNETGLTLWEQRERFSGTYKKFVTLGVTIARHRADRWFRAESRRHRDIDLIDDEVAFFEGPDGGGHGNSPEDNAAILEALRRLSPVEFKVVKARIEGYTFEEIGAMNGVAAQRVWVIYERASRKLREQP